MLCLHCSCTGFFLTALAGLLLAVVGAFSLPWLLWLRSAGCRVGGLQSCGPEAQQLQPSGCRVGAQWLCRTGSGAPRKVGSSRTRDPTHVPCIGRQILTQGITSPHFSHFCCHTKNVLLRCKAFRSCDAYLNTKKTLLKFIFML